MSFLPGVYKNTKKNGEIYFRSSITYQNKHISLGSFQTEEEANQAYHIAFSVLKESNYKIDDYQQNYMLSFEKWVILINFRNNGFYFKNPIYLKSKYFLYYLNRNLCLKFDVDDLFYYANHKIMKRGGHLFVSDYGMQVNILSRYGIRNFGVAGRDYRFVNGDNTDYRYANIEIINRYYGVMKSINKGKTCFTAKIHINGDYVIGRYETEVEAAIAYNKATGIMIEKGLQKNYPQNYISDLDEIEYAKLYHSIRISRNIRDYKL